MHPHYLIEIEWVKKYEQFCTIIAVGFEEMCSQMRYIQENILNISN